MNNLTLPQDPFFSVVKVGNLPMSCKLEVSSHWFGQGRTGTISNSGRLSSVGWDDDIDAYRLKGDCSNTLVTLYQHQPGKGGWTFPVNSYETWFGNHHKGWGEHKAFKNQMSYVTFRQVPKRDYWQDMNIDGNIGDWWFHFGEGRQTQDDAMAQGNFCLWGAREKTAYGDGCTRGKPCPGGTMHMINSRKVRCYYKNAREIRELRDTLNNTPSRDPRKSMLSKIREKFCAKSENIFENPGGGGTCLEYDTGKKLAKEYCSVGNRIAADANCTRDNLGNHYDDVATKYCKNNGRNDEWCSCYNVSNDVCKTHSTAAGCNKKRQTYDKLVEATPKDYKNSWNGMATCFGGVCRGKKYIPANSNQNCNRPVQVCVQDFDIQGIADSTINATCEQTANTNTQPSAGDSPSGVSPSGGSPSGGSPSGATPLDKNAQSRATSAFGNLTDTQKKAAVGLTTLFLFLIFVLIIF